MSDHLDGLSELDTLLVDVCEGSLADEKLRRLDAILAADPEAVRHYVEFIDLLSALTREPGVWSGEDDRQRTPPQEPAPIACPGFIVSSAPAFSSFVGSALFSYLVAALILGMGLLVAWAWRMPDRSQVATLPTAPVKSSTEPKTTPVGKITGMLDCRFADPSKTKNLRPKTAVSIGDRFRLVSGLMEIAYDGGARVILQGPVTYQVESPVGGYLSVGKLTARVDGAKPQAASRKPEISNPQSLIPNPYPSLSTIHYPLFTVRTPTAKVTDLGTEFGVEVDEHGITTSHVFRGLVKVQVIGSGGKLEGPGQVLRENQTARVEGVGAARRIVMLPAFSQSCFGSVIPPRPIRIFDLVDVVAGGDGYAGRRNRWIDPSSGRVTDIAPAQPAKWPDDDGKYHRVASIPFVDGVFVPDGRRGPVQVDSAGHTFADFNASENRVYRYLWAGGEPRPNWATNVRTKLGEIDYVSPGHGLFYMHANKGITFDLDAVRRAIPCCRLLRFRATGGNAENGSEQGQAVYADLWVLVDGQVRFRRRQINYYNAAFPIVVSLNKDSHFLTLAATDGGNGIAVDWIMFGDPRLELESTKPTVSPDARGR
jgi:hypothetical protein